MRAVIAVLLLLLAACADTPSTPTTSGGSSSGSGKIVTATPEEPFDCDDDLILEPHLPEECIPPEPPVPVKPAEPLKPDPIVGTYLLYVGSPELHQTVARFYGDNTMEIIGSKYRSRTWKKNGNIYVVCGVIPVNPCVVEMWFKRQTIRGEPNLVRVPSGESDARNWVPIEGLLVSENPFHLFDFFRVACSEKDCAGPVEGEDGESSWKPASHAWKCHNFGRRINDASSFRALSKQYGNGYGDTLDECQSTCGRVLVGQYGAVGEGNCSDYQG